SLLFGGLNEPAALRKNVTKDRKDSNAEREIPQAVFFAETVFPPVPIAQPSFFAGMQTALHPFRGAIATAILRWHAATFPRGFSRRAKSNGAQDPRRPAGWTNQPALRRSLTRA